MDKSAIAEALINLLQDNEEGDEPKKKKKKPDVDIEKIRQEAREEALAELQAETQAEEERKKAEEEAKRKQDGSGDGQKEDDQKKDSSEDEKERERERKLAEREVNISLRDGLKKSDLETEHLESISEFISYDRLIKENGEADADAVKKLTDALTSIALRTPPKAKRGIDDLRGNNTGLQKYLSKN